MSENPANIVISGAAAIASLGLDREAIWAAVRQGRSGFVPLTALESSFPAETNGGQAPPLPDDFEPGKPREVRYLKRAIADALRDAGIDQSLPYSANRCGWMIGTTLHGIRSGGQFLRSNDAGELHHFLAGSTLREATDGLGVELTGLAATTCSACSSSLGSIALAVTLLRSGEFDLIIAGGYDPIAEYAYGGFNSLRLVADGPLKPFARDRKGMKLAEGYGVVVLEREADAVARGGKVFSRVLGFGESADAHHLTQPHPQGEGAARAMATAIQSAGLTPDDIDFIAAHATATPDNDAGEFTALSRTFGESLKHKNVVGFKSHLGHTLGGAGATELILAAMALRDQIVPPTANSRPEDIEFEGLPLNTGAAKPAKLRASLNTSLGFGGANTCVVIAPAGPEESDGKRLTSNAQHPTFNEDAGKRSLNVERWKLNVERSPAPRRDVFITGVGVLFPNVVGNDAFLQRLDSDADRITADTGAIPEAQYIHLLNARRVRRMSDYAKLTLAAAALAMTDAGITDVAAFGQTCNAILGTTHGSSNFCETYYRQIIDEGMACANPMLFAEGVPNAAGAHLSMMLGLKGACQTIIGTRTAGLDALRLASLRIASGLWDRAVVGAAEEYSPLVNAAYAHCGLYAGANATRPFETGRGFAVGSGAVTLILESSDSIAARGGKARGRVIGGASVAASGAEAFRNLFSELGSPNVAITSANGTWIDRAEAAAVRAEVNANAVVTSLAGHVAETFSVTPLAGVAAALLGRIPRLLGSADASMTATTPEVVSEGVALATDYAGVMSAIRIRRER